MSYRRDASVSVLQNLTQMFDIPASLQSFLNDDQRPIACDTDLLGVDEQICLLHFSLSGGLQMPITLVL
jgi:hypothetical protein